MTAFSKRIKEALDQYKEKVISEGRISGEDAYHYGRLSRRKEHRDLPGIN